MRMTWMRVATATLLMIGLLPGCTPAHGRQKTLPAFGSEAQFQAWLAEWQASAAKGRARRSARLPVAAMAPPAPPAALQMAEASSLDSIQVTGTSIAAAGESITNNQVQGVDEGGIVKRHGDHLVVLRRGRLFTLRIGGDRLEPASMVDAFGPGIDPDGAWYDEMLVGEGTVAVIGYSYARGGTEVGLFAIDMAGGLRHRATYQLRSNDYYSSRNYASRLVGDTLVFYTPLRLGAFDREQVLPGLREWRPGHESLFRRILPAQRIHRAGGEPDPYDTALHTVTTCELASSPMACRSTAVLGPSGRVFHVAEDAVYVWTTARQGGDGAPASSVFRMPLDGSAPSALRTRGSPVDQMSFLQRDGWLNVLLASDGRGDGMWSAEVDRGRPALLRVPLRAFGDAGAQASPRHYRLLDGELGYGAQNRYVGDWLVYGGHRPWDRDGRRLAHAVRYADGGPVRALPLTHGLERIEALGAHALLVGPADDDLHFSAFRLGDVPRLASVHVQPGARQAESRTHGFFYRALTPDSGLLGLPLLRGDDGASVAFLRDRDLSLSPLGRLDALRAHGVDDGCRASCVDWYGNARPIFVGNRVFALMGYELVEGRLDGERLRERRRIDFTPAAGVAIAD